MPTPPPDKLAGIQAANWLVNEIADEIAYKRWTWNFEENSETVIEIGTAGVEF